MATSGIVDDQALTERITQEVEKTLIDRKWRHDKIFTSRALWFGLAILITALNAALFAFIFTDIGSNLVQKGWVVATSATDPTQPLKVDTSAIEAATRNFITVMGPIITGLALWLVTVVAERRLKAYDEAIEKLTDRFEKKFDEFKKETATNAKEQKTLTDETLKSAKAESEANLRSFREEIEKSFEKSVATIEANLKRETGTLVGQEIDTQKSRLDLAIDGYKAELQQSVSVVDDLAQGLTERFGVIADHGGYAKTKRGPLASVGRIHEEVSRLFTEDQRDEAVLLVRDMLQQFRCQTGTLRPAGDLKGDWFNLSAVLGRNDEEGLALEVCLAGLEQQNGAPVFT